MPEVRRRLGVTDEHDPSDFELAEPSKLGGEKVCHWSWMRSAVRRLQHDTKMEESKQNFPLVSINADDSVLMTKKLLDKLDDLVVKGSVAIPLTPPLVAQRLAVQRLATYQRYLH